MNANRQVIFTPIDWKRALSALFPESGNESFLFGLASARPRRNGIAYMVESLVSADCEAFSSRSAGFLSLNRSCSSKVNLVSAASAQKLLIPIHVHSHPRGVHGFSSIDDYHELELHRWLIEQKQPLLLSVVKAKDALPRGRVWVEGSPHETLVRVGLQAFGPSGEAIHGLDRQQAFGDTFRTSASLLRIGIVGLGGVGFPVAEQLARSGFQNFVLVDPDRVEVTNLNRLQGLSSASVGKYKVHLAQALIQRASSSLNLKSRVRAFTSDVYLAGKTLRRALEECDLILALTDDHLSRISCLEIAMSSGSEYLQAGMDIRMDDSHHISGLFMEFTGAESGRYCPICSGRLDPGQASLEARRYVGGEVWEKAKADGYIPQVVAPAVMSLNAMTAGALVAEIQKRIAGMTPTDLFQLDFMSGTVIRKERIESFLGDTECSVCGRQSICKTKQA